MTVRAISKTKGETISKTTFRLRPPLMLCQGKQVPLWTIPKRVVFHLSSILKFVVFCALVSRLLLRVSRGQCRFNTYDEKDLPLKLGRAESSCYSVLWYFQHWCPSLKEEDMKDSVSIPHVRKPISSDSQQSQRAVQYPSSCSKWLKSRGAAPLVLTPSILPKICRYPMLRLLYKHSSLPRGGFCQRRCSRPKLSPVSGSIRKTADPITLCGSKGRAPQLS